MFPSSQSKHLIKSWLIDGSQSQDLDNHDSLKAANPMQENDVLLLNALLFPNLIYYLSFTIDVPIYIKKYLMEASMEEDPKTMTGPFSCKSYREYFIVFRKSND